MKTAHSKIWYRLLKNWPKNQTFFSKITPAKPDPGKLGHERKLKIATAKVGKIKYGYKNHSIKSTSKLFQ